MIDSKWLQNPDRILTGFGVLLAAIAVLYFGRETILDLSPVVKSFLLICGSAIFVLSSFVTEDKGSKIMAYILSTISYLTFLIYFIGRISPSSEIIFLLLGFSGLLFIFVGRKIGKKEYEKSVLKKAIFGILIVVIGVIALDTAASEPLYSMEFDNSVEIGEEPVNIGQVRVTNDYLLPQVYDIGRLEACRDRRELRLRPEDYEEGEGVISGLSSKTVEYELSRTPREHNVTVQSFQLQVVDDCGETVNDTIQISRREIND